MISIVVPAHNESSVIARALDAWVGNSGIDEIDIVVVCNGCTDDTADVARRFGPAVRVIESDVASKVHALNLGDQAARGFPRVYADADVVIAADAVRTLTRHLEQGRALAVAPTPDINLTSCSWLVRKYYDTRSRLPSSREGIGGSGVYALSEEGRKRFTQFPSVIADDMYVRLQFRPEERQTLLTAKSMVFPPRTVAQLIAIRTRAYTGLLELAHCFPELRVNNGQSNDRALIALVKDPRLWPGLLIYGCVNSLARYRAGVRWRTKASVWERDHTSRATQFTASSK